MNLVSIDVDQKLTYEDEDLVVRVSEQHGHRQSLKHTEHKL